MQVIGLAKSWNTMYYSYIAKLFKILLVLYGIIKHSDQTLEQNFLDTILGHEKIFMKSFWYCVAIVSYLQKVLLSIARY